MDESPSHGNLSSLRLTLVITRENTSPYNDGANLIHKSIPNGAFIQFYAETMPLGLYIQHDLASAAAAAAERIS